MDRRQRIAGYPPGRRLKCCAGFLRGRRGNENKPNMLLVESCGRPSSALMKSTTIFAAAGFSQRRTQCPSAQAYWGNAT
jgi:hypothetical protein